MNKQTVKESIISSKEQLMDVMLANREIKTQQQKEEFFNPQLKNYENDFDLTGIDVAKKRILAAIEKKELIVIYGDYDVDGVCSSAILYNALHFLGAKVLPYIPHREKEGYGLSKFGLDQVSAKGAALVITVDNGIVALDQAEYAKSLKIDLIITDHHIEGEKKPTAVAIVHSTKMCGAGVAWSLVRKLIPEQEALKLLDLVAVASICDLIPLVGVNRVLVKLGLQKLNQTNRVGFLALFEQSGVEVGSISTYHVGHIIGPRINAVGRLENAMDALRLLCTNSKMKAFQLAKVLNDTNDQKKKITTDAILAARDLIKLDPTKMEEKKIIFLSSKEWIPGVIGLIAGRICEEYKLPAVILSEGEVESKGSARSVDGVNIVEVIRSCSELLIDVGGHPKAAGFTLKSESIELFKNKLIEVMQDISIDKSKVNFEVEGVIDVQKITKDWVEVISRFEPFGIGNPRPLFESVGARISDLKAVGNGQHLKLKVAGVDAIAFSKGELMGSLKNNDKKDLVFSIEINQFNGYSNLQFKVLSLV